MKPPSILSIIAAVTIACSLPLASGAQVGPAAPLAKAPGAPKMVSFTSPAPAAQINNGTTTVSLRLTGTADASTLKVVANGKDITDQFPRAACAVTPCSISATLSTANDVANGWNYLTARVTGAGGSADSARMRFFSTVGNSSDNSPGNSNVSGENRQVAALVESAVSSGPRAADTAIFPFNYYPPFNVHIYTAQSGTICIASFCSPSPYILLMDRRTLTVTQTGADPSVLPTLDSNTMVIVNLPGTAAQTMDFSSVGGTNFTAKGAPVPYNYSMVGYGGAQSGTAYECYNGVTGTPWHGIEGNLVNIGTNTPLYTYVPDGNPAFVIQPGATTSTITIGTVQNFNLGAVPPPNRVEPALGGGTIQYTSPDLNGAGGGFWVLVLDPFLLTEISSTFYGTNSAASAAAIEVERMGVDLSTLQVQNYGLPSAAEYRPVVFITTIGTPFDSSNVASDFNGDFADDIIGAIWNLGTSWYAFSDLTSAPAPSFSMVGIPGTNVSKGIDPNNGSLDWEQYSAPTNPQAAKWFSTTVDGDTGMLKGLLKRNTQFTYSPNNVGSFDPSTVPSNPTPDQLLSFAIIDQLGSSQPVEWPIENGAAYQYLSGQIISQDFYGGVGCGAPQLVCNDIHFYYTGDEVDGIVKGVDPRSIPYPGNGQGFTQQDLSAVATQLNYEKTYLGNVRNFETWMEDVETNGSVNIGSALSSAATEVASQLNQIEGLNPTVVPETKLHLATDIINDAASVIGAFGPAVPGLGVLSGGLRLTANLLTTGMDLDGTKPPKPDPYVNQLSDLLSSQAGQAASSAVKFNSDMEVGTGTLFNSFYSDWYRLQTVGLLTVNPDNPDWYFANAGTASSTFTPLLISGARRSFYVQAVPQYFEILMLSNVPQRYLLSQSNTQQQIDNHATSLYKSGLNSGLYSWDNRNTPATAGCQDYLFVVLNTSVSIGENSSDFSQAKNWDEALGSALMGPPSGSDGLGSLGLNRNFFYDSRILNIAYWKTDPEQIQGGVSVCGPQGSATGGLGGAPRIGTTTQLTAATTTVATGISVTLHIKVDDVDSSNSDTPKGALQILRGSTVLANIELAASHELDYTLDSSLLVHGSNQIVANYRGDSTHLDSQSAPVTITVGDPGFTVAYAQTAVNLSSKPNSQAAINLTLTSNFGFTGTVQFSCANVPQYLACSFSSPELVAQPTPQTTTVSFTMVGTLQSSNQSSPFKGLAYGGVSLLALAGMAGMMFAKPRGRAALLLLALAVGLGSYGCGGGSSLSVAPSDPVSSPTPPSSVTTTVTINATSGTVTQSQQVQLSVQ